MNGFTLKGMTAIVGFLFCANALTAIKHIIDTRESNEILFISNSFV